MRARVRAVVAVALAAASLTAAYAVAEPRGPGATPSVKTVGIAGRPGSLVSYTAVPEGAAYLPGSSVLRLADGALVAGQVTQQPAFAAPNPAAADRARAEGEAQAVADRSWVAAGTIPGPGEFGDMAERALLDLRLLTRPDGATIAAPYGIWGYVWPRDASVVAVAYAVTGHSDDGVRVLRWLATQQRADGTWAPRTRPDGSGPPDDRPDQLDAGGWFSWAVWMVAQEQARAAPAAGRRTLAELAPAVLRAARAIDARVDDEGLPEATPDYWENAVSGPTLGTSAILLAGMRGAADIARLLGEPSPAAGVAGRLARLVAQRWPEGAARYADGSGGADSAVAWLGPPFVAGGDAGVQRTRLNAVERVLTAPNGGLRPGEEFRNQQTTWTPETAGFALAHASLGERTAATRWLRWLDAHRTGLGALPEKVDSAGNPVSVAPLGWTSATVLLALTALDRELPSPPAAVGES